jgi:glutamate transport system substrate-binding protein
MTDDYFGGDERLRRVLHRYAGRVQPVQDQWARIEGRAAVAEPAPPRRRGQFSLVAAASLAAVVVLVAAVLVRPDEVRVSMAGDFVEPDQGPQYAGVAQVPEFPAGSTMAAIQERGFIRVGIKFDQPSFGTYDPDAGTVHGFDAEIAKLLAVAIFGGTVSDAEDRIHWVQAQSKNRESMLRDGAVDIVVATYSITAEREEKVSFAGPYYRSSQDIMVRDDDSSIAGVDDLAGRRVCTAQGSTSYQNLVTRSPDALPVVHDTYSACAQALADGEVDAVTTDRAILAGYLHQAGGTFKLLGRSFAPEELYGIGLRKGDGELRTFLTQRLRAIVANGDWARAADYSIANLEALPPEIPDS